jgi:hypothetical protein
MKFKILALLPLLLIAGCALEPKTTVKAEPAATDIGPFFLPANESLNSISINYFTAQEEPTSVLFSMTGEIDWLRTEPGHSLYHRMIFNGLEESAVYQFRVSNSSQVFTQRSYIKTPPYGGNYRFDFAVACINSPLILDKTPHFLVLLSKEPSVREDEFLSFFTKYKKILSSTVLVPLFDFTIGEESFSLSGNGFYILRYKTANIILIYKNFSDAGIIPQSSLGSDSENNFIVASVPDRSALFRLKKEFHSKVKAIYALSRDADFNPVWITVESKSDFVLKN